MPHINWDWLQKNGLQIYFNLGALKIKDDYIKIDDRTCKMDTDNSNYFKMTAECRKSKTMVN